MTAASKPETLAAALVAAQAAMPKVEPDAVNPHFKSRFVSLDHLIAKTRGVLNAHGLAIVQSPAHIDGQPALETTIHHVSGQSVSSVMPLLVSKNDMRGLGGAITYARRYAWAAALGICADEDDDGEGAAAQSERADKPAGVPAGSAQAAGEDGNAPPPAATPTEEDEAKIIALVEEKGGGIEAFRTAMATARDDEKTDYAAWFKFQLDYWQNAKKPFKAPAGAAA